VGEPIFQPFPAEVVFQGYAPFKEYKATLFLRNNDKVRLASCRTAITSSFQAAQVLYYSLRNQSHVRLIARMYCSH
jgi:hypothetical protein